MDPVTRRNNWREIIERCLSSGLPVNRWCKLNKIAPSTLYSWMARFRKEEAELFEGRNTSEWIEITKEKLAANIALTPTTEGGVILDARKEPETNSSIKHQSTTQSTPIICARIGGVELSISPGSIQADIEAVFKAAISL